MNYSDRFQDEASVTSYESVEYGPGSLATWHWELQKPFLRQLLEQQRKTVGSLTLLDFACGTGRVLSFLETLVDVSQGLDIAPAMARIARQRCKKSIIHVGDICSDPNCLNQQFDVISSFRFILNAGPELSRAVLRQLRRRINEKHGLLIANVHGSSRSLRHPVILLRRAQAKWNPAAFPENPMLNELSPSAARRLFGESGFEVVGQSGYGLLPGCVHRSPLGFVAKALDRRFAGAPLGRSISMDLIFVCRPR